MLPSGPSLVAPALLLVLRGRVAVPPLGLLVLLGLVLGGLVLGVLVLPGLGALLLVGGGLLRLVREKDCYLQFLSDYCGQYLPWGVPIS